MTCGDLENISTHLYLPFIRETDPWFWGVQKRTHFKSPVLQYQWPEDVTVNPSEPSQQGCGPRSSQRHSSEAWSHRWKSNQKKIPQKWGFKGPQQRAQKLTNVSLCCLLGHYLINIGLLVPVSLPFGKSLTALLLLMLVCKRHKQIAVSEIEGKWHEWAGSKGGGAILEAIGNSRGMVYWCQHLCPPRLSLPPASQCPSA